MLKEMASESGVCFDGEVIALNGKGSLTLALVMRRDNCMSQQAIKTVQREVPVFYMIFDLLYHKERASCTFP